MKKPLLFFATLFFGFTALNSQSIIPNGNFENWEEKFLFSSPIGWLTDESPNTALYTTVRSDDRVDGSYSLRLTSVLEEEYDYVALGYAVYGKFPGQDKKGFATPFKGDEDEYDDEEGMPLPRPWVNTVDKGHFSLKYDVKEGDAAIVWIYLLSDGEPVCDTMMIVTGQNDSWQDFEIDFLDGTAIDVDELLVIFTSSFIFGDQDDEDYKKGNGLPDFSPVAGSWIMVDNIYFSLDGAEVPGHDLNGSFEDWEDITAYDPEGWTSSNTYLAAYDIENVTRTAESYSGDYAVRLESVLFDVWDEGNIVSGMLSLGEGLWDDGGIPFTGTPQFIGGAYKYLSAASDAFLSFQFLAGDYDVGGNFLQFPPADEYTEFIAWQNYYHQEPDFLRIDMRSGEEEGAVLYMDDLRFMSGKEVVFEVTDQSGNPVSHTGVQIEGVSPIILGHIPYLHTDPGGNLHFLLPEGSYQYLIDAPDYDPVGWMPFEVDEDGALVEVVLEGGEDDPAMFSVTFVDDDVDRIYFAGDEFGVEIFHPDFPDGLTPSVTEGIYSGPDQFDEEAVLDNRVVSSIAGGRFTVTGTIKDGVSQGVIGFDISNGGFPTGPFPIADHEYDPHSGSDWGLAIVGVEIPFGDITAVPGLEDFDNLYDTEKDIDFAREDHGSIKFGPGLNIIDNRQELTALHDGLALVSIPGDGIYYVEIDPASLTFLAGREAEILVEGYELTSFTIRKTEFGVEADYDAPEDVRANTTAELVDNVLTFTVDGFSRYTVLEEPKYDLTLEAEPAEGGVLTGQGSYHAGEEVSLNAEANAGYEFMNWRKDGVQISDEAAFDFTMPAHDVTLTARFVTEGTGIYELTLLVDPEGAGVVSGAGKYTEGEEVSLSVETTEGWVFTEWTDEEGDPVELTAGKFVMPGSDATLTATFREIMGATIDPGEFVFADFSDATEFETTVTWNDASEVERVYVLIDGDEIDMIFAVEEIDQESATLKIYSPSKKGSAVKGDDYVVNGYVVFDVGDPAPFTVTITDPTWWIRITIEDMHSPGTGVPNAEINITDDGDTDVTVVTDQHGIAELSLPSGTYDLQVEAWGYITLEETITVKEVHDGNRFNFVLERDDQVFVVVMETIPADGDADVSPATDIVIIFERDISEGGLYDGFRDIYLRSAENEYWSLQVMVINGNELHIIPEWPLVNETSYILHIPAYSVVDAVTNYVAMEDDLVISFTTGVYQRPSLTPDVTVFGLAEEEDVEIMIDWGSESEIAAVWHMFQDPGSGEYMSVELEKDSDYTIDGDVLTISAGFITGLDPEAGDVIGFHVEFGSGHLEWFGVYIVPSVRAYFDPSELVYDLSNPGDLHTSILSVTGGSITAVEESGIALTEDDDYRIEGVWLFIHDSYLSGMLQEADDEIDLTIIFDDGYDALLTITAIESGVVNATIDPSSATYFEFDMPEYFETLITWNDASYVDSLTLLINYGWSFEKFRYDDWEILDDDGTTAVLRIYIGGDDDNGKGSGMFDATGVSKGDFYIYVGIDIYFDTGAPAKFMLTIIDRDFDVSVAVKPDGAGSVTGEGWYHFEEEVYLEAFANAGYEFSGWWKDNEKVSTDNPYIFEMPAEDLQLTAWFIAEGAETYTLTLRADPADAGTVTGGGEYEEGDEIGLNAVAADGYAFVNWTDEDEEEVSDEAGFTYTMPGSDITLTANFIKTDWTVTFTVLAADGSPIEGAEITVLAIGEVAWLTTGTDGKAEVTLPAGEDYGFSVSAEGYEDDSGTFTITDDDVEITVNLIPVGLTLPDIARDRVVVYPNPGDGLFNLEYAGKPGKAITVEVISVTGNLVYAREYQGAGDLRETIDLRSAARGIYFLRIRDNGSVKTVKMVFR